MYRCMPAAVLTAAVLIAAPLTAAPAYSTPPTTPGAAVAAGGGATATEEQHLGSDVTWVVRALVLELVEHRGAAAITSAWLPSPPFPGVHDVRWLRYKISLLGLTVTVDALRALRAAAEDTAVRVAGVTAVGGITVGEPGGLVRSRRR